MFRVAKIDVYISTPSRELHMIGNYKLACFFWVWINNNKSTTSK
jgi:hypothetical protein